MNETERLNAFHKHAHVALIDSSDRLALDDGWQLVWAVTGNGERVLWLYDPENECGSYPAEGIEHEELGPLPDEYRDQIAQIRKPGSCGAPTAKGTPCRNPADRCNWHPTGQQTLRLGESS